MKRDWTLKFFDPKKTTALVLKRPTTKLRLWFQVPCPSQPSRCARFPRNFRRVYGGHVIVVGRYKPNPNKNTKKGRSNSAQPKQGDR